jgi:hypothetical protein
VILWFIVKFGLLALCHESHIYIYKKKTHKIEKNKNDPWKQRKKEKKSRAIMTKIFVWEVSFLSIKQTIRLILIFFFLKESFISKNK